MRTVVKKGKARERTNEQQRSAIEELRRRLRADFRQTDRALRRLEALGKLEALLRRAD